MAERLTRSERRAETRERLLDAASSIALSRGFGAITIEAVAEEAGLTSGAIYSNFASKEELLLDVAKRLTEGMQDTSLAGATDLPDLLRRGVDEVIARAESANELALALEFYALTLRNPKLRRAVRSAVGSRRNTEQATPWLQTWADERGLALDAPALTYARALDALSIGLAAQRAVYGKAIVTDEIIAWAIKRFE